jgi:glycosyltransferase involved in cell wall biosynthesis
VFAYNHCWEWEVANRDAGLVPSHRLFGLEECRKLGHDARFCKLPRRFGRRFHRPWLWRIYQALVVVASQGNIDAVVATHESAALPLLAFRRLRLLRCPVLTLSVALSHPKNCRGMRGIVWRWLLRSADVVNVYASAQAERLRREFHLPGRVRVTAVPLGVDTAFFSADDRTPVSRHCLSVGTNEGRDFATLVRALPAGVGLTVVTDSANEAVIRNASTPDQNIEVLSGVPINLLRGFYQRAAIHILPMHTSSFSSGQTVLLENMALGKLVIVTDTEPVRDYVEDGRTAIVVKPYSSTELRRRIEEALADPARYAAIGARAAVTVRERFSAEQSARGILGALTEALARMNPRRLAGDPGRERVLRS